VDNWTVPRLPESARRRTFQSSRRGLALPRQRPKGRRRRRDFGTVTTRRRDAARWRDEKRKAQRFVLVPTKSQTVEAERAQSRKGRICRLEPRISQSLRAKRKPLEAQVYDTVSEPPGGKGQVLAIDPGPRRNRRRRERRAIRSRPSAARKGLSEPASRRQASSSSRKRRPHAGESGVDRKVGPISLWGRDRRGLKHFVIASEAKQSRAALDRPWIASSLRSSQ
jgi:hypothetical protein